MNMEELEISVDAEGRVTIAVRGVKGARCLDLTRGLEAVLGGVVESRTHTSDFYEGGGTGQRLGSK